MVTRLALALTAILAPSFTPTHKVVALDGPLPEAKAVDAEKYPGADAVVLSDVGRIRFLSANDPSKGYELRQRVAVKILTPGGRGLGRVAVPLDHWTELVSVAGRSGKDGKLDPHAVAYATTASYRGVLYTDARSAIFDIPSVDVGEVIEYETVIRSRRIFAIDSWRFDGDIPVISSRFEVEVPKGWTIASGYFENGRGARFEPEKKDNLLIFEKRDLAPLEAEPLGLPLSLLARRLQIAVTAAPGPEGSKLGVFTSWNDVAAWFSSLTQQLAPSIAAEKALDQFLAGTAPADLEAAIYRFVRDDVRYVALHRGVGALRPRSSTETFETRFGDCKDMAALLVSLYRHRGIEARPALIGTRGHRLLDRDVPSVAYFDHMIVALPGPDQKYRFIDPTDKGAPFGELSWMVQGQTAAVLTEKGVELVEVPISAPEKNLEETTWYLDQGGAIRLEVTLSGTRAGWWRNVVLTDQQLIDHVAAQWVVGTSDLVVDEAQLERGAEDAGGTVSIKAKLSGTPGIELPAERRAVPLGAFFGGSGELRVPADRRSPVVLGVPRKDVERVVLEAIAESAVLHRPAREKVEARGYAFELDSTYEGGRLSVVRSTTIRDPLVPADQLGEVRKLTERLYATASDAVVLKNGGAR